MDTGRTNFSAASRFPERDQRIFARTPTGCLSLERHVDALRRAASACGHMPDENDWQFPAMWGQQEEEEEDS